MEGEEQEIEGEQEEEEEEGEGEQEHEQEQEQEVEEEEGEEHEGEEQEMEEEEEGLNDAQEVLEVDENDMQNLNGTVLMLANDADGNQILVERNIADLENDDSVHDVAQYVFQDGEGFALEDYEAIVEGQGDDDEDVEQQQGFEMEIGQGHEEEEVEEEEDEWLCAKLGVEDWDHVPLELYSDWGWSQPNGLYNIYSVCRWTDAKRARVADVHNFIIIIFFFQSLSLFSGLTASLFF